MKKLIVSLFLSSIIFLTGCSKYWYQEGKSFEECKNARNECFAELKKRSDLSNLTVEYEIKFMNDCMTKKDYREVSQDELPLDAKREEPDSSFHWRARGLAGTLKKQ
jgi:PBP1b-binding outer membrane lipoprotein LpoB